MPKSKKAFSLIELLTVIGIIVILLGLTVTVTSLVHKHSRIMATRHTLEIIHQALLLYKEATGDFPQGNKPTAMMEALTKPITIKDYKGDILRNVAAIFSTTEIEELKNEAIVQSIEELKNEAIVQSNVFVDAWKKPILYYYGNIEDATPTPHPYDSKGILDGNLKNVHWNARNFDLISNGPDGSSSEAESTTQKDDITNFT